ncbi:zinc finger CCCH domain-containing protein 46 isoform X1 [Oryza brachyantha]|uniref:C3H1-type domain-containing protein n=1 Tax=Oryza brachyantha TaxID=4533 RepID=J3MHE5_ORYBR|nr:zinc finger CCCH domain-containing protein 46 isoform X1 [Oryza brachyantha]
MSRRQEICRNFQRGSCKYGAQCRYLHASPHQQQQARPNPFGFGTGSRQQQPSFGSQFQQQQQQQQKPNPFGFGVQGANAQSRNAPGPAKPFQNKWVRDPSAPTKQAEAAQPPQAQAAHTSCEDLQSCRQQISEDFKNEAPIWKLTCYAHLRSGPCDIKGDISFEELRAKAYEEGKQGHSLQSIVEGERNLQNAKLMEFTNLLNSAHPSQTPNFPTMGSFPGVNNNSSFGASQTNGPPVFSSFSQIGAATNLGPGSGITTPGVPASSPFGQSSSAPHAAPTFGSSQMKFGVSSAFGNQGLRQPFGTFQSSSNNFPKSSAGYQQSSASSAQHRDIDRQSQELLSGMMAPTSVMDEASAENIKNENQDDSIWLKEKWAIGEIPLDEPPQRHVSHVF